MLKKHCRAAKLLGNCHIPALRRHFGPFIVEIVEMWDDGNVTHKLLFIFSAGAYSKGAFLFSAGGHYKEPCCTSCPYGKVIRSSWFSNICPNEGFLHHEYANTGFYKEFAVQWSFVAIVWIHKIGGTYMQNKALKSRSIFFIMWHCPFKFSSFWAV